jgi:hypothetical protein
MEKSKRKGRARTSASNPVRAQLQVLARSRLSEFIDQKDRTKLLLEQDPDYPDRTRKLDIQAIAAQVEELKALLGACAPYVAKIRSLVGEITDPTLEVACYLLFSRALQSLYAGLMLASEGFNHQLIELIRGIREAIDLAVLFMYEQEKGESLGRWFDGEIISNETARAAFEKFINDGRGERLPVAVVKSGLYTGLSYFNHMSYVGLFESIDVFARDFDVSRIAGLHFVAASSLPYAKGELQAMVVALKQFYRVRGDEGTNLELDLVLRLFGGFQTAKPATY